MKVCRNDKRGGGGEGWNGINTLPIFYDPYIPYKYAKKRQHRSLHKLTVSNLLCSPRPSTVRRCTVARWTVGRTPVHLAPSASISPFPAKSRQASRSTTRQYLQHQCHPTFLAFLYSLSHSTMEVGGVLDPEISLGEREASVFSHPPWGRYCFTPLSTS